MIYQMMTKHFVYSLSTTDHFATVKIRVVLCRLSHKNFDFVYEFVYLYRDEKFARSKSCVCLRTMAARTMHCNTIAERTPNALRKRIFKKVESYFNLLRGT